MYNKHWCNALLEYNKNGIRTKIIETNECWIEEIYTKCPDCHDDIDLIIERKINYCSFCGEKLIVNMESNNNYSWKYLSK